MRSSSMTFVTRPRSSARLALRSRLSLTPALRCRMVLFLYSRVLIVIEIGGHRGRSTAYQSSLRIELHAKGQAETRENLFDFVERFTAEILGAKHLGFALLNQVPDGLNIGVLEAVIGTDAEFQLFHRAVQHLVHLVDGALRRFFRDLGHLLEID